MELLHRSQLLALRGNRNPARHRNALHSVRAAVERITGEGKAARAQLDAAQALAPALGAVLPGNPSSELIL